MILAQVLEVLRQKAAPHFLDAARSRMEIIRGESGARTADLARLAASKGAPGQIDVNYLCAEVGRALSPGDIVFNEGIRSSPAIFDQVMRTVPGSIFGMPGSALGYSGGAALGAKLARPDALAVQIVGDGEGIDVAHVSERGSHGCGAVRDAVGVGRGFLESRGVRRRIWRQSPPPRRAIGSHPALH